MKRLLQSTNGISLRSNGINSKYWVLLSGQPVAEMLSLDSRFWSQKSLKEYCLVPYIDEELMVSMTPGVGGKWHTDFGCLPWPKKPFLASRPSAVWQPYPPEPECFFLDAYEWKNDKVIVERVSSPPSHCIDLMRTRLLMLSELSDDVSISTDTGFVLLFQRKQDGNITSKQFKVKLPTGRNDQRPFKGYLELLEEKFWTDLAPRLVPVGVPTWGELNSEDSNEAPFQRNNLSECLMGKSIVQCRRKCDWSTIEGSRILLKSDKQNSSTFTIATQGKVSSGMIPGERKYSLYKPENQGLFSSVNIEAAMRAKIESGGNEPFKVYLEDVAETRRGIFNLEEQKWQVKNEGSDQITLISRDDEFYLIKEYGFVKGDTGKRITFASVPHIMARYYLPPVRHPVYPFNIGDEVLTIGFDPVKDSTPNGAWGKVDRVVTQGGSTKVQVTINLENETKALKFQDHRKFIVADPRRYLQDHADADLVVNNQENDVEQWFFFNNAWLQKKAEEIWDGNIPEFAHFIILKALFQIRSQKVLNHKATYGTARVQKDELVWAVQQLRRILRVNHTPDWWDKLDQGLPVIEGLPKEKIQTSMLLTCRSGYALRQTKSRHISKKIGCNFKATCYKYVGRSGIYVSMAADHIKNCQSKEISKELEEELRKLFTIYDKSPQQALWHIQREQTWGSLQDLGVTKEEINQLTTADLQKMKKKFMPQSRALDIDLLKSLCETNKESLLFYKTDESSDQPLAIGIMTLAQKQVLQACHELILVDACHAIDFGVGNKLLAMMVRDPFGHGFPVAFCISRTETAEDWKNFIAHVLNKADISPSDITVMTDKSTSCMAALDDLNIHFVLCIFHVMQAWGRYLKSVGGIWKTKTFWSILGMFRRLTLAPQLDQAAKLEEEFKDYLSLLDRGREGLELLKYYQDNWATYEHQVWRCHRIELYRATKTDTNNLLERFFRSLKRDFLSSRRRSTGQTLKVLLEVSNFYTNRLGNRMNEITKANSTSIPVRQALQEKQRRHIQSITESLLRKNKIDQQTMQVKENERLEGDLHGCFVSIPYEGQHNTVCLGDLSCTCKDSAHDVCIHVQAVCQCVPKQEWTNALRNMIRNTALMRSVDGPPLSVRSRFLSQETKSLQFKEISFENGIYECWPSCFGTWCLFPENDSKAFTHTVNLEEGQCSCHMWRLAGTCPHLIGIFAALSPTAPDVDNPFLQCLEELEEFTIEREREVNEAALQHLQQIWAEARPSNARVESLTRGNQSERKALETELNTEIAWAKRNLGPTEFSIFLRSLKRHCVEFRNEFESSHLNSSKNAPSTDNSRAHDPSSRTFRNQIRVPRARNIDSSESRRSEGSTNDLTVPSPIPFEPDTQRYRVNGQFREQRRQRGVLPTLEQNL